MILICLLPAYGCLRSATEKEDFPFRNTSLSWAERVQDLVGRLTVEEMAEQMSAAGDMTQVPPIERLGIGPYHWGVECLHGDGEAGQATAFPQALGMAASFRYLPTVHSETLI